MSNAEQKPVAWLYESVCRNDFSTCIDPPSYAKNIRPLYTTPPQRTWVGLTMQDVKVIEDNAPSIQMAIFMAEATLKEKNNA